MLPYPKYSIGSAASSRWIWFRTRRRGRLGMTVARGARCAESVADAIIGRQPSEPAPGYAGEGTATARGFSSRADGVRRWRFFCSSR